MRQWLHLGKCINVCAGFLLLTACGGTVAPTPVLASPAITGDGSSAAIRVQLDAMQSNGNISPYIYGLAGTDDSDPLYSQTLKPMLMRWGGNPATRYNWVLGNAWNAGRDWEFRNGDYGNPPGNVADTAVRAARAAGSAMLITIPTIGWVAKNTDSNTRAMAVPPHGNAPVSVGGDAIDGYDPAANRALTSVQSLARKNSPFIFSPDPHSVTIYQDEWVAHLVASFGPASAGGVTFYSMDNEPDLWSEEHTDVHPARMSYDDVLARYIEYASAVKDVDPSARITGPVLSGWQSYFYSDLDRGNDNFHTGADRQAHNGQPFTAWFLDQMHQYDTQHGRRTLDVLDIHYYPQAQGIYTGATDPNTNALRLRSTRALWDGNYTDESWINAPIQLIPRMRDWINTYYPGTHLGISEWNFGADTTLNGALAISTALGIYGREGVYLASYWRYPPKDSPGFSAFRMYTNFDGKGATFGDTSTKADSSDSTRVASFAARDSKTGRMRLILINLQPDKPQTVQVQLKQSIPAQKIAVYALSAQTGNRLEMQPPITTTASATLSFTLPAYSATLFDMQP